MIYIKDLKILKRDADIEEWNYDKIYSSIIKTGLSAKDSGIICNKIEAWARKEAKNGIISSSDIKSRIIIELKTIDPLISQLYEDYKK